MIEWTINIQAAILAVWLSAIITNVLKGLVGLL